MLNYVFILGALFSLAAGWLNDDKWQTLDYEYYNVELPANWVFRFGGKDINTIHKRKIKVETDESAIVEYELGTLLWGTEMKSSADFDKTIMMEIRSFRKTSGDAVSLDEVVGKIPEASWPEYMKIINGEDGKGKGYLWKFYLLKGETSAVSIEKGSFAYMVCDYKFFMEKNGMVYCLTVMIPDVFLTSSPIYDEMANRIIKNFKVK